MLGLFCLNLEGSQSGNGKWLSCPRQVSRQHVVYAILLAWAFLLSDWLAKTNKRMSMALDFFFSLGLARALQILPPFHS